MNRMYLLIALMGYLLGGVLFSYHLPRRLKGIDVTQQSADGNPGGANAVKLSGIPIGLMCIALDLIKGFLPVRLGALCLNMENALFAWVMLAPVLGHATAPYYRNIQGGKAIAVSFGVLLALLPSSFSFWVLAGVYIFFSTVLVIRPNERRTVITFGVLMLWSLLTQLRQHKGIALGCMMISGVVMWKNRHQVPETDQSAETAVQA